MLEKRCLALLEYLNKQCLKSGYKVFSIKELASIMPSYFNIDESGILECVVALKERDYISLKYFDEQEVCLCPSTKGRLVFENRLDDEIDKKRTQKRYFLYSFLGGFSGALISGVFYY